MIEPISMQIRARLQDWLAVNADVVDPLIEDVRPASNGFSADTFFARLDTGSGTRDIVIRIQKPEEQIFLGTSVRRQALMMDALSRNGLPSPQVISYGSISSVGDNPFIIMERAQGTPFPQTPPYTIAGWVKDLDEQGRATLWRNALSMLGAVNRLTPQDGFEFLHQPCYGVPGTAQYLAWLQAWRDECLGGGHHPVIDAGITYLMRNRPPEGPVSVIWGDSNPCNMLFDQQQRVQAILDFEAAMSGPAEADLGWWFFLDRCRVQGKPLAGVPDRRTCINIYEHALGRPVQNMDYFEILGGVRMALVIVRTTSLLVRRGALAQDNDAGVSNPMVAVLAQLLGMAPPEISGDFADFSAAMRKP